MHSAAIYSHTHTKSFDYIHVGKLSNVIALSLALLAVRSSQFECSMNVFVFCSAGLLALAAKLLLLDAIIQPSTFARVLIQSHLFTSKAYANEVKKGEMKRERETERPMTFSVSEFRPSFVTYIFDFQPFDMRLKVLRQSCIV